MIEPVVEVFEIVTQPADYEVEVGGTATFTVEATGVASYQWQYQASATGSWFNTSSTGATTDTITVGCTAARYKYSYRCVLTGNDGSTLITDEVKMIEPVVEVFEIVAQPIDYEVEVGETATFTVEATGVASYQWQYKRSSTASWANTSSTGATTETITVECNTTRYNYSYRCVLTGNDGTTLITDAVKMVKPQAFEIVTQPVDCEVAVGGTATFTVEATSVVSYQWQYKRSSTAAWSNTSSTGATTDTITVECNTTRYNYLYRCVLTGKDGTTLITDEVKMVNPNIVLDGVTYQKLDESTVTVVSYTGSASTVVIPEIVEGYTVTAIAPDAFKENTILTSITLPNTITVIGARAFKGCTALSQMNTH